MASPSDKVVLAFAASGRHKPDAVKKQQGTYRADRAKPEAEYAEVGKELQPVPPSWMRDPLAQDYYNQGFILLRDAGVLTHADIGILEIYAAERAAIQRRYMDMYREEEDPATGEIVLKTIPGLGPGTEKLNAFRTLSSELGFTPVSRHKAGRAGTKGSEKKDEWSEL